MTLKRILIANRAEIAVRVVRACRDLGLTSIAVYSDPDADSPHVVYADEAYALPGERAADTYLNISALLDIAIRAKADAVHPGYGFLSENAEFARAVIDAGLTWVGPSPEVIDTLGNKVSARAIAERVDAPLAPGSDGPIENWEDAHDFAETHGLPIAIKAAYGGGGRGMKIVHEIEDVEDAVGSAQREAKAAFGREECFVEKFLIRPRHVEAQILADQHGTVRVVGLRDCTLQRRNQKLVEEAPAPFLTQDQADTIRRGAIAVCEEAGYVGAGTVEFLLAADGTISFLEVNTRLQVEHPVTEETTDVDLVAWQLKIADGEKLDIPERITPRGHAIEFRINAEDVAAGYVPCPGEVTRFESPTGPGVRMDAGVKTGSIVPGSYDSLIAKLICWGATREQAIARARDALTELVIEGVATTVPFHLAVLEEPEFTEEFQVHTAWIENDFTGEIQPSRVRANREAGEAIERFHIELEGRQFRLGMPASLMERLAGVAGSAPAPAPAQAAAPADDGEGTPVTSPYAGNLIAWKVEDGAEVSEGETVCVIEAMKMESNVSAPAAGTLHREALEVGDALTSGQVLARIS